jgi:hypothetical protein
MLRRTLLVDAAADGVAETLAAEAEEAAGDVHADAAEAAAAAAGTVASISVSSSSMTHTSGADWMRFAGGGVADVLRLIVCADLVRSCSGVADPLLSRLRLSGVTNTAAGLGVGAAGAADDAANGAGELRAAPESGVDDARDTEAAGVATAFGCDS